MKKKTKVTLSILICAVAIVGTLSGLYLTGALVNPTEKTFSESIEIPKYDILQVQYAKELEILEDYNSGEYSYQNPYVIVDPYSMNPGSALVIFEDSKPGTITVTIQGDHDYSTFTYTKSSQTTHFEIPIIGLYIGRDNIVTLQNQEGISTNLTITTDTLPVDFQTYTLEKSVPEKMEPGGITLFVACFENSYTALIDDDAQVRGYLSNTSMGHCTSIIELENGNMLSSGDEYRQVPYNMNSLWEFNWLGKIIHEFEIPNGVHHDVTELLNGDFLIASNNVEMFTSGTREDVAVIIDRKTGEVKKEYDFRTLLDENRDAFNLMSPNLLNVPNTDWMHMNAAIYDAADNLIIVSSPIQSQVVAINPDTSEIQWIFGPTDGYEGTSEFLKKYLLTPVGDNFEWPWGQHAPVVLPDQDSNPDTLDLLLFDNGQNRNFYKLDDLLWAEKYSRAVVYRIDVQNKTVQQIWEYGKDCKVECYAMYLGNAAYLPVSGNYLVNFGGQLQSTDGTVPNIISGVFGKGITTSRVDEVTADGEIVFSVEVENNKYTKTAETYRAERLELYSPESFNYLLGEQKGTRLGIAETLSADNETKVPQIFFGKMNITFSRLVNENGRIVADGNITYDGEVYMLAKAIFVLRSEDNVYVYTATSGLNGRFFMSLDTSEMKSGTYQLTILGGVREGNDYLSGKNHYGYINTEYKVTVP